MLEGQKSVDALSLLCFRENSAGLPATCELIAHDIRSLASPNCSRPGVPSDRNSHQDSRFPHVDKMGVFAKLLPAFFLAVAASAHVGRERIPALGATTRRSTDSGSRDFLRGIRLEQRSENPLLPVLYRRDAGCPSYAPQLCDGVWCVSVCCMQNGGLCCRAV